MKQILEKCANAPKSARNAQKQHSYATAVLQLYWAVTGLFKSYHRKRRSNVDWAQTKKIGGMAV